MRACRTSPAAIDQYENLSNLPKQETLDKPCHTLGVWVWQWQWQDRMQGDRVYVVAWNSCTGEVVHVDALVGGAGSSGCDRINIAPFNYNGRRIQARAAAAQLPPDPEREGLAGGNIPLFMEDMSDQRGLELLSHSGFTRQLLALAGARKPGVGRS